MYLEYFGLKEAPFRITPHTDFFFEGANRGATLEALLYAITHDEGIVKVTGEVGSGKTMLCRVLLERLPPHVETVYLANPSLSRDEILFALADELKINLATNRVSAVLRALQEHLIAHYGEGRQVVVLIDEAHAMPAETLEEIRLLSNLESNRHKLLQIVLFGQPELDANLARTEMRQLKERITHNFALEPLVRSDIAEYLRFRMRAAGYRGPDVFSAAAVRLIAKASLGLTRRVNILADKSLLAAFAENTHLVTARHVRAAVRDSDFFRRPRRSWRWLWGGALAVTMAGAVSAAWYFYDSYAGSQRGAAPPAAALPPPPPAETPPAAPVAAAAPAPSGAPTQEETPVAQKEEMPVPSLDKLGPATRERLLATRQWLDSADQSRWFIQLLAADGQRYDHVESFVARATRLADAAQVRVYSVELEGTTRVGVIYGDYPSREAALAALAQLPEPLKAFGPYARPIRHLRP